MTVQAASGGVLEMAGKIWFRRYWPVYYRPSRSLSKLRPLKWRGRSLEKIKDRVWELHLAALEMKSNWPNYWNNAPLILLSQEKL